MKRTIYEPLTIQAWAAQGPGELLTPYAYSVLPKTGEVVVDVLACSLTRGDVGFIDNQWGDTHYPCIPGLEVIGRVAVDYCEPGVGSVMLGEVVGIGYQVGACFECEYCQGGTEQFCRRQKLMPLNQPGGLADHLVVDRRFVFPLAPELHRAETAPLMCAGLTVSSAIRRADVTPEMRIGILGVGGLGHLALQFLHKMGCEVIAITHSPHKVDAIIQLGADRVILTPEETIPIETFDRLFITASDGVDWEAAVESLLPLGKLSIVGLPRNVVSFSSEALADHAARQVIGGYIGSRSDTMAMLATALENDVLPQAKKYPMADVNRALVDMRSGAVPFSAVMTW